MWPYTLKNGKGSTKTILCVPISPIYSYFNLIYSDFPVINIVVLKDSLDSVRWLSLLELCVCPLKEPNQFGDRLPPNSHKLLL
jgi:hypothetical protein